jgi:hypothetical protein
MDITDVDFVIRAKKQLRLSRWISGVAIATSIAALVALVFTHDHHDLAASISYGALLGAFLVNSDFLVSGAVLTRSNLIAALETQINRDPAALQYVASLSKR